MAKLEEITPQLVAPFPLESIELLPKGKIEKDGKTLCMGMPYADVRVYEDRLNSLACGEWSTPPCTAVVAGNKLLTYVTVVVCGVPHTDVGEALTTSENGGTEAWAQGFKRACSQFGLGRYLYDLDKEWVPYHAQRKNIDLDAAGIRNIARKMYQKAGIPVPGQVASSNNGHSSTDKSPAQEQEPSIDDLKALCQELFGIGKWKAVRAKVVNPEQFGDIPDDALSAAQKKAIYQALLSRKRAVEQQSQQQAS